MPWGPIILLVIQIFGPVLADLFKKLIERWFNKAAKGLPAPSKPADIGRLFDKAIAQAPKRLRGAPRRALLRLLKGIAMRRADAIFAKLQDETHTIPALTKGEMDEVRDGVVVYDKNAA